MATKDIEARLEKGIVDNQLWINAWTSGDTDFHHDQSDPYLDAHEQDMFEGKTKTTFHPLCGKSVDMLWMYNKGHHVSGVEIAEKPVKEFYEEHKIDYVVQYIENVGNLYKSKDGRLKLYVADIFHLSQSLCGQYDIIWDSKSFVAINIEDRKAYTDLLLSLMKPDGVYYLHTLEYDESVWPGPPHSTSDETVKELYGARCDVITVQDEKIAMPKVEGQEPTSTESKKSLDKPFQGTLEALSSSTYICSRLYKMTFK